MFQETLQTISEPENVEKAISLGAFGMNIGLMILGAAVCLSGYAFKTKNTDVATAPWIRANFSRFVAGAVFMLTLSIAMVMVPDQVGLVLSGLAIDSKNMAAPFILGVGFAFLLISVTTEPSKRPEG